MTAYLALQSFVGVRAALQEVKELSLYLLYLPRSGQGAFSHLCRYREQAVLVTVQQVTGPDGQACLLSSFCLLGRSFAPRFLQTAPHCEALALR
ncbi:MAG: hypothetical protein L6435_00360 [Anaerolineae bacterium]|nr:hypothetical protein [Anaerolineae bacterium]